jgi:hypothetical protein
VRSCLKNNKIESTAKSSQGKLWTIKKKKKKKGNRLFPFLLPFLSSSTKKLKGEAGRSRHLYVR